MFNPNTTEVLTRYGWKKLVNVTLNDKIAAVNKNTLYISFKNARAICYSDDKNLININGEIIATKEQQILQLKTVSPNNSNIITVEELTKHNKTSIINAGIYEPTKPMDLSCREMVFLLLAQTYGYYNKSKNNLIMKYLSSDTSEIKYMDELLTKMHCNFTIDSENNHIFFNIDEKNLLDLYFKYFNRIDASFNWVWLDMDSSQACYFIYNRITKHHHDTWDRLYQSPNHINIDVVQAISVLNQKGSIRSGDKLYITNQYRDITTDNIKNINLDAYTMATGLKMDDSDGYIIRQNNKTTIVC